MQLRSSVTSGNFRWDLHISLLYSIYYIIELISDTFAIFCRECNLWWDLRIYYIIELPLQSYSPIQSQSSVVIFCREW